MIGIDTNILIRYLVADDPKQAATANHIINHDANDGSIRIENLVIAETIWVLSKTFRYNKTDIIDAVRKIIHVRNFVFDDLPTLKESLEYYASHSLDFADTLIGILNRKSGCVTTMTYDAAASRSSLFTLAAHN